MQKHDVGRMTQVPSQVDHKDKAEAQEPTPQPEHKVFQSVDFVSTIILLLVITPFISAASLSYLLYKYLFVLDQNNLLEVAQKARASIEHSNHH